MSSLHSKLSLKSAGEAVLAGYVSNKFQRSSLPGAATHDLSLHGLAMSGGSGSRPSSVTGRQNYLKRKALSAILTPSMQQIADQDRVVELHGLKSPPSFEVGGKHGHAVTHSRTPSVHKGWRVVAIDGVRIAPAEVGSALVKARQSTKYTVTFRVGEDDGETDMNRRRLAEEADRKAEVERQAQRQLAEQKAADAERERQRKIAEDLAAEAQRKKAAEEAEKKAWAEEEARLAAEKAERERLRAEDAAREAEEKRRAAEEAERKRREEQAERQKAAILKAEQERQAAAEAERKRKEEEEEAQRKAAEEAERKQQAALEERRRAEEERRKAKEMEEEAKKKAIEDAKRKAEEDAKRKAEEENKQAEEAAKRKAAEQIKKKAAEAEKKAAEEADRQNNAELQAERQVIEKRLEKTTGLPPRDTVADPGKALLQALTQVKQKEVKKKLGGPCDKCDGPHHEDDCPHFKKKRDQHNDAWAKYGSKAKGDSGDGQVVVRNARVIPQPGDGSCLYHSLSYGLGQGANATKLRAEIADFIAANPKEIVADNPLKDWVLWDSGMDVASYSRTMRTGSRWGGAVEIAVCARIKGVAVHIYEKQSRGYARISTFGDDTMRNNKVVNIHYGGRVHYDAIQL